MDSLLAHLSDEQLLMLERIVNGVEPDYIVENIDNLPVIDGYSLTANGCLYSNNGHGFLPALMEKMFAERKKYKSLMLEAKKRYEKTKSQEDSNLASKYHNFQTAKKIQLNSLYGALSNEWFRWFNFDNAESITSSGQVTIKYVDKVINQYLNKVLKTEGEDYVVASDTDSVYIELGKLVEHLGTDNEPEIVDALDQFCEKKIQPCLDKSFEKLAQNTNSYRQKMFMKREVIANKGIWRGKKMYILNTWDVEGIRYNEPKLKLSGIEAVRSSTPHACRENIKEAFSVIMNGNQQELIDFIEKFRKEFNQLPFQDIAFPRSVNGLDMYKDSSTIYKKQTPIHVKGSLLFNHWIRKKNINHIPPIKNGDKIRFSYLKMPNPVHDTVIATPDELPPELGLDDYVDRDMQFKKSFLEPIRSITSVIGWQVEHISTLEDFFS